MKSLLILSIIFIIYGCITTTKYYKPRKVEVIGEYLHDSTKTVFPLRIGNYEREEIIKFDENQTNIGVTYSNKNNKARTHFTIYIYPAGTAHEDRLLYEYYSAIQSIAISAQNDIDANQTPFPYSDGSYRIIGIEAQIANYNNTHTVLTLFECGKWFLKYRISSMKDNFEQLDTLQNTILKYYSPITLVKKYPVKVKSTIRVYPIAFQDSSVLYSVMYWAFKKSAWILNNVDSLERCAGYPGLYLLEHTQPILDMVNNWEESSEGRAASTKIFFSTLKILVDKGYLDEFIMDLYRDLLVTPPDMKFDFDEYFEWKRRNLSDFQYEKYFYIESNE